MDYKLQMDPGALVNLPDVRPNATGIQVSDTELSVQFGPEFNATVERGTIAEVKLMDDPRPDVYFPMGVSAAVDRLGRDTLCIVTSHMGLVRIDFNREIAGRTCPTDYSGKGRPQEESAEVQFRSLIL